MADRRRDVQLQLFIGTEEAERPRSRVDPARGEAERARRAEAPLPLALARAMVARGPS